MAKECGSAPVSDPDESAAAMLAAVRRFVLPETLADKFVDWLSRHVKDGPPDPSRVIEAGGRYYRLLMLGVSRDGLTAVTLWRIAETPDDAMRKGALDLLHFNIEFKLAELGGNRTELTASLLLNRPRWVTEERHTLVVQLSKGEHDSEDLEPLDRRLRELDAVPSQPPDGATFTAFNALVEYVAELFGAEPVGDVASVSLPRRPRTPDWKRIVKKAHRLRARGDVRSLRAAAKRLGIPYSTLRDLLKRPDCPSPADAGVADGKPVLDVYRKAHPPAD